MAKDQHLPGLNGAKVDDTVLMNRDYYEGVERFLSRPGPSSKSELPMLKKLRRERSKMIASIRESRETLNFKRSARSKIDTGKKRNNEGDEERFNFGLVRNPHFDSLPFFFVIKDNFLSSLFSRNILFIFSFIVIIVTIVIYFSFLKPWNICQLWKPRGQFVRMR